MKIYEITEDAPTMTGKQAALKAQQKAAFLKSKTTDSGMVDKMNIVGKGMQDKVNKAQSDADSLSRAAGVDPNQVNKDIKRSLSSKPKFKDKFRKTTETNHAGNMTNDQMVQKAKTVKAKLDKAEATGDADLLFSTGADLGELLMNNLYPKMLKFTDIMLIRMEKEARKNPDNPGWQEFMKELGPLKAKLAQQKKELMKKGMPLGRQDVGETTTAGSIAGAYAGGGNGFVNGGPGTIKRAGPNKRKKKVKNT